MLCAKHTESDHEHNQIREPKSKYIVIMKAMDGLQASKAPSIGLSFHFSWDNMYFLRYTTIYILLNKSLFCLILFIP